MKKLAVLLLTFSIAIMSACSDENKTTETDKTNSQEKQKIIIGSHGSDADIWQFIAQSQAAKDAGLDIDVYVE